MTIVNVSLASMLAFVFTCICFRFRGLWFKIMSIGLLFPLIVAILPIFIQIRTFGLAGNLLGVILPIATIQIIAAWNEYFLPLIVLGVIQGPLSLMQFQGQYGTGWSAVMT